MSDRRVIVNADDFGLCAEVNEAIAKAHREGVLSSASLLVNAPGTGEAVALARELPGLGVGLHLALTELKPLTDCPHLAPHGRFPASHAVVCARLMVGLVPRREIRDEVAAQFERALATGLPIDHVDGHGHIHVVPPLLEAVVEACLELGVGAVRWPLETATEGRSAADRLKRAVLARWCRRGLPLVSDLRRPDAFYGLARSGRMTAEALLGLARRLPEGVSEIMVHPATADEVAYRGYLGARELDALCDPAVAAALPPRVTFAELGG